MSCPTIEQLAAYDDALLAPPESARVRRHIDACPACRRELAALARTARMLAAMPMPEVPEALWAGVAARIEARPHMGLRRWWKTAAGLSVAAGLAIAIVFNRPDAVTLPRAEAAVTPYVIRHELLAAQDPLTDRAGLAALLIAQEGRP